MIDTRNIHRQLASIWATFKAAGIEDNLAIVEHIAALLTKDLPFPSNDLRPRLPDKRENLDLDTIGEKLGELANTSIEIGGKAGLFDAYILFQLKKDTGKGLFPIPRHIVNLMLALAQIGPGQRIADFTCGSGGFFTHIDKKFRNTEEMLGIEINPQWARIAQANFLLHGLDVQVVVGDALRVAGLTEPFASTTYDRILMAPSFGISMSSSPLQEVFHQNIGTQSDIVLPSFVLKKLNNSGRAVIIVPDTLLSRRSNEEIQLRKTLVTEYHLEAVIALPIFALQPFSGLQTNLLLLSKASLEGELSTWLFSIEDDGYPRSKNRDLTSPPDLTKAEGLQLVSQLIAPPPVVSSMTEPREIKTNEGIHCLTVQYQFLENKPLGVVLCHTELASISSVSLHENTDQDRSFRFLLVQATHKTTSKIYTIVVDLLKTSDRRLWNECIENPEHWLRTRYYDLETPPSGEVLIGQIGFIQSIAIDIHGRLTGVLVNQRHLDKPSIDLLPSKHLSQTEDVQENEHPVKILGRFRVNERKLRQHVDSFMGRLDIPSMAGQQIPSRLFTTQSGGDVSQKNSSGRLLEMVGDNAFFSPDQQLVWERVRQQIREVNGYLTALYFTTERVQAGGRANTLATLDLLLRMGLIVQVTILEEGKPVTRYRRVTERDIWHL